MALAPRRRACEGRAERAGRLGSAGRSGAEIGVSQLTRKGCVSVGDGPRSLIVTMHVGTIIRRWTSMVGRRRQPSSEAWGSMRAPRSCNQLHTSPSNCTASPASEPAVLCRLCAGLAPSLHIAANPADVFKSRGSQKRDQRAVSSGRRERVRMRQAAVIHAMAASRERRAWGAWGQGGRRGSEEGECGTACRDVGARGASVWEQCAGASGYRKGRSVLRGNEIERGRHGFKEGILGVTGQ